ncbi:hypothetical protein SPLC1_S082450 [Arthrospira platensis C1]|nr:hypothetical protein SPLC1_S082450 [Arthrospira platensis C1]
MTFIDNSVAEDFFIVRHSSSHSKCKIFKAVVLIFSPGISPREAFFGERRVHGINLGYGSA